MPWYDPDADTALPVLRDPIEAAFDLPRDEVLDGRGRWSPWLLLPTPQQRNLGDKYGGALGLLLLGLLLCSIVVDNGTGGWSDIAPLVAGPTSATGFPVHGVGHG